MKKIISLVIVFFLLIVLQSSLYIVEEGRQAIITQFGRPIGIAVTKAGVHLKLPIIQKVRLIDKRILYWDGTPNQIPTRDKKYISVDTTARWRIVDPLKFIESLQDVSLAQGRLTSILDAATRDVISGHNLVEAVRNSNDIVDFLIEKKNGVHDPNSVDVHDSIENIITFSEIPKISIGREKLSELISKKAEEELTQFGIKIVDVQLRRISYEKTVEDKVYERMISERQRMAAQIRSIGEGEKAKIEGRLSRDLQRIKSDGYKKAQIIRGEGEAMALNIFNQAIGSQKDFYEFNKTMELYQKIIPGKAKFIISSKEGPFKALMESK